ncbi:MAG: class I tRNA ligase family protein [Patescibacteria group bacterium]
MTDRTSDTTKSDVAKREEATQAFWRDNAIFEKSLEAPAGGKPKGEFVFYDGPPFATGLPHYGHLLAGTIKDVIPRFKTMQGYRVPRRWGWDCHGLPIENLVEKELGLKTKKDIEDFGIEKFNDVARKMVLQYTDDWRRIIPRTGRFVDMANDYKTMDSSYTESIWWAFKKLYDDGFITEGRKAMHLCPRCETTLANFEVNQGYKDIADISVYVKFALSDEANTYLLAWTTTAWSLPGNAALAVNPEFVYAKLKIKETGEVIIVAKERLSAIEAEHEVVGEIKGSDLVGKKYTPLFSYYTKADLKDFDGKSADLSKAWRVYGGSFVTAEDGTGIVHIAPSYGEDDLNLAKENGLPFIQHVGTNGIMKPEALDFAGLFAKPKEKHESTDVEVIRYLAKAGALFAKKKIVHSYPHCWRCDTPLLNFAASSWFVKVTAMRDEMVENNKKTSWTPEHIRDGRFGKWLEGARDWAISRSRFWGAPMPVWRCKECGETKVVGAISELAHQKSTPIWLMRHGEAPHYVNSVADSGRKTELHLTERGREQARASAEKLKDKGIEVIIASDITRARETAEITAEVLGIPVSEIRYDERLREIDFGDFDGKPISMYRSYFNNLSERFTKRPPNGENLTDIRTRVGAALREAMDKIVGKKVLFVAHETPLWMLAADAQGFSANQALTLSLHDDFLDLATVKEVEYRHLPRNGAYELDLHRPYIDEVKFDCACGAKMLRIPEVFDCWFESGSMPYAEQHYPFENKEEFERTFPADFIGEGVDQTRCWFYNLLALSTGLFEAAPFRHVVVNGTVLAADGQKMSKRLKNYPDPLEIIDQYGADALRYYLMSSPAVHAEDLNFSERGVAEVSTKVIGRLTNVLAFFEQNQSEAGNVSRDLDDWILSRLAELVREVTTRLEKYEIDRAAWPIADFIEDLSVWYIRRSRKNFSPEVTRVVLETLAKVMAPFTPFLAEHIYKAVRGLDAGESVHLSPWPVAGDVHEEVLSKMKKTREIVAAALALRSEANIKVRQPLGTLFVSDPIEAFYPLLVADEVNVKEVVLGEKLALDLELTEELRLEGEYRELLRSIQDLRKERGLVPTDRIILTIPEALGAIVARYRDDLLRAVSADEIRQGNELDLEKI